MAASGAGGEVVQGAARGAGGGSAGALGEGAATEESPACVPARLAEGPIGNTETSCSESRNVKSLGDGGELERGKEPSSKTTCREMRILFVDKSRHL